MDPWLKFGTTGTARAVAGMTLATTALITYQSIVLPEVMIFDLHLFSVE
jgi:hypothetical protein